MQYWFVHLKTIIIVIELWRVVEAFHDFKRRLTGERVQAPFNIEADSREKENN